MPRAARSIGVVADLATRVVACSFAAAVLSQTAPAFGDDAFVIAVSVDKGFPLAERASEESARAIDAAIAALTRQFGAVAENQERRRPASVVVHRDASSYQRAIRSIGAKGFEENLAVTDYDRRESHVAVQPACRSELMQRIGLPLLTRRQLAHEAAHLWCDERWPRDYRAAPRWLREGLATWASEVAMRKLGLIDKAEADPFLSTRIVLAQRGAARLVEFQSPSRTYDPFAGFDRQTMYALDWAYCRWRLEDSGDSNPGESFYATHGMSIEQLVAWFTRDSAGAMKSFAADLRSMKPEWEESGRSLEAHDAEWIQVAFSDRRATAWRRGGPSYAAYRIKGSLQWVGTSESESRVLFARDAFGYLAATFGNRNGVEISRFDERTGSWRSVARNENCSPSAGAPCEFEIVLKRGRVAIEVGGRSVCSADTPGMWIAGPWGLSVEANKAAVWRFVRIIAGDD